MKRIKVFMDSVPGILFEYKSSRIPEPESHLIDKQKTYTVITHIIKNNGDVNVYVEYESKCFKRSRK